jgi:diaminopimelate epimerase
VPIALSKWQGLGNDYLVVEEAALPGPLTPRVVAGLCSRHLGVGSDGILVRCAPTGAIPGAVARMRIFNPDGSESEMCGNGIRIFARYLASRGQVTVQEFTVETLAGPIRPQLLPEGRVRVDMGWARFVSDNIDLGRLQPPAGASQGGRAAEVRELPAELLEARLDVGEEEVRFTFVDVGNPHCVVQVPDPGAADIDRLGPAIEHHPAFPNRVNVEFFRVEGDGSVTMRVWERGVGETQACGTGATAVGAACVRRGLAVSPVTVHLPGGDLVIEVRDAPAAGEPAADQESDQGLRVWMTGPAEEVFTCELAPALLQRLGWPATQGEVAAGKR